MGTPGRRGRLARRLTAGLRGRQRHDLADYSLSPNEVIPRHRRTPNWRAGQSASLSRPGEPPAIPRFRQFAHNARPSSKAGRAPRYFLRGPPGRSVRMRDAKGRMDPSWMFPSELKAGALPLIPPNSLPSGARDPCRPQADTVDAPNSTTWSIG